jgi:TraM recognition site of TraD and TraG
MIAEAVSEEAPVAPLFAAMASETHWIAAQIGQASSGRLDPPLLMGLDEVTQICPVPLPSWLSDSGGKGIQVCAVVHGEAQLAEPWGDHGRQIVLDTSSVKVFLPGITDTTTLTPPSQIDGQPYQLISQPGGHAGLDWAAVTRLLQPQRQPSLPRPRQPQAPGHDIGHLARWVAAQADAARQAGLPDPEITRTLNSARRTTPSRHPDHQAEAN